MEQPNTENQNQNTILNELLDDGKPENPEPVHIEPEEEQKEEILTESQEEQLPSEQSKTDGINNFNGIDDLNGSDEFSTEEHGKIDDLVEETTLKIINLVSEKSVLKILKMLPSNEDDIKNKIGLSDYTYYRKSKRLSKNGLITIKDIHVETTKLGKLMIELFDAITKQAYISTRKELETRQGQ